MPQHFGPLKAECPEGKSVIFAMIAEPSLESFKAILGRRGAITYEAPHDDSPGVVPLYEYTWNHTTLQWLKQDRTITYLQCLFPHDRLIESVREMWAMFPDEVLPHLEFIRFGGRVTCSALPIVRYTTAERLNEIIALHEAARRLHRQSARLHAGGWEPAQARRCRPDRLQGRGRSLRPAQSGQDAHLRSGADLTRRARPLSLLPPAA